MPAGRRHRVSPGCFFPRSTGQRHLGRADLALKGVYGHTTTSKHQLLRQCWHQGELIQVETTFSSFRMSRLRGTYAIAIDSELCQKTLLQFSGVQMDQHVAEDEDMVHAW